MWTRLQLKDFGTVGRTRQVVEAKQVGEDFCTDGP